MTENAGTTRPTRRRATSKTEASATATTAKPRARATAPAEVPAVDENGRESFVFEMQRLPDTKSYAVYAPPKSSGCVGKLYFPLGTHDARVKFSGGPAA